MNADKYVAQKEEIERTWPWIDPTLGNGSFGLRQGVEEARGHVVVRTAAVHKGLGAMIPIHSSHIERTDGHAWELFSVHSVGVIEGKAYVWGMFVEGLGAFNVMVPVEHVRVLAPEESAKWARQGMAMVGSHTGKHSYNMPSGVEALPEPRVKLSQTMSDRIDAAWNAEERNKVFVVTA